MGLQWFTSEGHTEVFFFSVNTALVLHYPISPTRTGYSSITESSKYFLNKERKGWEKVPSVDWGEKVPSVDQGEGVIRGPGTPCPRAHIFKARQAFASHCRRSRDRDTPVVHWSAKPTCYFPCHRESLSLKNTSQPCPLAPICT